MSFALVFAGQGMQHAQMLPWLAEDAAVAQTGAALGQTNWRAALDDAQWVSTNRNAQILLTGIHLAAWGQLAPLLPAPAAVAGYSVGEVAAFSAAGVYSAEVALQLAVQRAQWMDACAAMHPGGLLAVSGLSQHELLRLCEACDTVIAIENDTQAFVVGGAPTSLTQLGALAEAAGAHCTAIRVNVASHTPWMQEAATQFAHRLTEVPAQAPSLPLCGHTGDRLLSAPQALAALAHQIAHPVRWSACMDFLHDRHVNCVLEIGPGAALARMWNQRFADIPARSVDEFRSVSAIVNWIERHE